MGEQVLHVCKALGQIFNPGKKEWEERGREGKGGEGRGKEKRQGKTNLKTIGFAQSSPFPWLLSSL